MSIVVVIVKLSGKSFSLESVIIFLIASEASNKFAPPRFLTSSITTGLPYSRAKLSLSFPSKDTLAISLK